MGTSSSKEVEKSSNAGREEKIETTEEKRMKIVVTEGNKRVSLCSLPLSSYPERTEAHASSITEHHGIETVRTIANSNYRSFMWSPAVEAMEMTPSFVKVTKLSQRDVKHMLDSVDSRHHQTPSKKTAIRAVTVKSITPAKTPSARTPTRTPATKTGARTPATKTPVRTPATKTPARTPATKTSARTPATKTPARTPATKTPARTPATKTPARTPATKTPARTPATKTPARTPATKTPAITPATKTPARTPATKTPARTSATKTSSRTPETRTPARTPATKTPARTPATKTPATRTPATKTPARTPVTKTPATRTPMGNLSSLQSPANLSIISYRTTVQSVRANETCSPRTAAIRTRITSIRSLPAKESQALSKSPARNIQFKLTPISQAATHLICQNSIAPTTPAKDLNSRPTATFYSSPSLRKKQIESPRSAQLKKPMKKRTPIKISTAKVTKLQQISQFEVKKSTELKAKKVPGSRKPIGTNRTLVQKKEDFEVIVQNCSVVLDVDEVQKYLSDNYNKKKQTGRFEQMKRLQNASKISAPRRSVRVSLPGRKQHQPRSRTAAKGGR